MGDKSPKSAQKQSKQNQAKADATKKQKQQAIYAKQSPGGAGGKKKWALSRRRLVRRGEVGTPAR